MMITYSEYGVSPIQLIPINENITYVVAEIDCDGEKRFKFEKFNEKCRVNSPYKESFALGDRHKFTVLKVHNEKIYVLEGSNSISQYEVYASILREQLTSSWLKKLVSISLSEFLKEGKRIYLKTKIKRVVFELDYESESIIYNSLSKLISKELGINPENSFRNAISNCWVEVNSLIANVLETLLESNLLFQKKDIHGEKYYCYRNIESSKEVSSDFVPVQNDKMEIIDLNGNEYIYCYTFQSYLDLARLQNTSTYRLKIGKAQDDWLSRVQSQMGTSNSEKAIVLILVKCMSSSNIERGIHHFLKSKNKWITDAPGNEWFHSNVEEIKKIIESLK